MSGLREVVWCGVEGVVGVRFAVVCCGCARVRGVGREIGGRR